MADLRGRKPILLFGIGLFLVGSAACGFSPTLGALIVFRTVQGLGAGAMQTVSLTVIGDIYSVKERARMQGLFGGVWGLAGLIGPLMGGLIVKYLSWRWVFFVNLPVGLLAAALLSAAFHEHVERREHVLDYLGAFLLSGGVLALLSSVQGTVRFLYGLPVAAVLLSAFVWVEARAPEPLIPLKIFKIHAIAISAAAGALFSGAMFGAITFVPLYVQAVLKGTPTQAGGMITPMIVAWPIFSMISGRLLMRTGFRPLIVGGFVLASIGNLLMSALLKPGSSIFVPEIAMAVFGAGLGLASTALLIAVQTSVSWELRGVATASYSFFRTVGGALGIGLMGGVLVAQLTRDPRVPVETANALLSAGHAQLLSPDILWLVGNALERALTINFWLMFLFSMAALVAGLFFPRAQAPTPAAEGTLAPTLE